MPLLLSLLVGVGLSAAAGFRVFVPLLVVGIAQRTGHAALAADFAWLGSNVALAALGLATLVEIAGYYIPWVDNALDTLATPAAVIAGIVLTGSMVTEVSPFLRWTLAVVAGGGTAGAIQATTVLARGFSTGTTGGLGNFVVATLELVFAVASAALALLAPVLVVAALGLFAWLAVRLLRRWRERRRAQPSPPIIS